MKFDDANLVIISTMSTDEAAAFVLFLASEILRHKDDITKARLLMKAVSNRFKLKEFNFEEMLDE